MPTTADEALVVDASVGVKLVLPEDGSGAARALFRSLFAPEGPGAMVPDLFFVECANALRRGIRRYGLPADLAGQGLRALCDAGWEAAPSRTIARPAMDIAREEGISVYDAVYVALSDRAGAPLVTADRPLFERLSGTRHRVRWLGEFTPDPPEETPPGV